MKHKIEVRKLLVLLLLIMIINIPYLNQTVNNIITAGIQILIIIFYMYCRKKENGKINKELLIYCVVILFSTFLNFGISTRLANATVNCIEYLLLFLIIKDNTKERGLDYSLKVIFKFMTILLLIIDTFILITKGTGYGGTGVLSYYLIGNKFTISYFHMFYIGIYFYCNDLKSKKNKIINVLLILFSIFICKFVDCSTGIIGCCVTGIICLLNFNNKITLSIIKKPLIFLIVFIGMTFLLIGTDKILSNKYIENIIVNIFDRSLTLTGRLQMYEISWNAFLQKPWLGYGINSTYVEDVLGYGNAQNGLLKILLDYGVLGFAGFLVICFNSLKTKNLKVTSIYAFLYGMAICTTVEINISGLFFLGLAIMNASKYELEEKILKYDKKGLKQSIKNDRKIY